MNENHFHDIAKFLLGMTTFWAYVGFSQFMLIWYANIPEETFFYEMRMTGGGLYNSRTSFCEVYHSIPSSFEQTKQTKLGLLMEVSGMDFSRSNI